MLLVLTGAVWSTSAQSAICQSKIQEFPNIQTNPTFSSPTLVRNYADYQIVHVQSYVSGWISSSLHTFLIIDTANHDTTYAQTDFGGTDAINPYDCSINDMEIYDGVCYFCGSKTVDYHTPQLGGHGEVIIPRFVTYGFAGCFSITAILTSTGGINYHQVNGTTRLDQLAITTPTSYDCNVLVSMVGESDTGGYCLAELAHLTLPDGTFQWRSTVNYIPESDEVFSDILALPEGLVMVSHRFSGHEEFSTDENEGSYHGTFYLHKFSLDGCYYDDVITSFIPYRAHYNISESELGWHYDKANMRLCNLEENNFCLAYGVEERAELDQGGARIHFFSDIYVIDSSIYYPIGSNVQPLDLRNKKNSKLIFLLTEDDQYPNGLVSSPSNHYFFDNTVKFFSLPNHKLHSIDTETDNYFFDASGYDPAGTYNLFLFKHYRPALTDNSCFTLSSTTLTHENTYEASLNSMDWRQKYTNIEFTWNVAEPLTGILEGSKNKCEKSGVVNIIIITE